MLLATPQLSVPIVRSDGSSYHARLSCDDTCILPCLVPLGGGGYGASLRHIAGLLPQQSITLRQHRSGILGRSSQEELMSEKLTEACRAGAPVL